MTLLASPAGIVRRASRVPSPFPARGEGTRDARLRMSAGEAMTLLSYQKNLSELLLRLSQMDVMLDRNFWRSFAVFVRKYGDNQSP